MRKEAQDDAELEISNTHNFLWRLSRYIIAENDP